MSTKGQKLHTEVEIVFFPSVARIWHLDSIASPEVAILFFCTLDFKDAATWQEWKALIKQQPKNSSTHLKGNGMQKKKDSHIHRLRVTQTEPFSILRSNMLVSSFRKGSSCRSTWTNKTNNNNKNVAKQGPVTKHKTKRAQINRK